MGTEVGKPGINWTQVSPEDRARLQGLIEHYRKEPHPFRACVRDNTKRFGPDRAKRICAVLKDLIEGGTGWRKGGKSMSEEIVLSADEIRDVCDAAEAIAGRRFYDPTQLRAGRGTRIGGRWIEGGFRLDASKDPVGGTPDKLSRVAIPESNPRSAPPSSAPVRQIGTPPPPPSEGGGNRPTTPSIRVADAPTLVPGKLKFVKHATTGGIAGKSLPRYDVTDKGGTRIGEIFQEAKVVNLGGSSRGYETSWRYRYSEPGRSGRLETAFDLADAKRRLQDIHDGLTS